MNEDGFDGLTDRQRRLLKFLLSSGIKPTPEQLEEVFQFDRRVEEATDLADRMQRAYPVRPNVSDRARRFQAGDPNIVKYDHGDGEVFYRLAFTEEQRDALAARYLAERPAGPDARFNWGDEADIFVRTLEGWADSADHFEAIEPESQKIRVRTLGSVANAFEKLDQALGELDSGALGYWYGCVVDALAVHGIQVSEADDRLVSMLRAPLRAVTEAGEARRELRAIIEVVVGATRKAADELPKYDHVENDWRLKVTLSLERLVIEHGIPFETTETGFAAEALRSIFELAGRDVEKVSYWLKKAAEHPDSHARFLERLRGQA